MMADVLRRVFRHTRYKIVVLGVALMVLSAALLLPNLSVLGQILSAQGLSFIEKLSFIWSLYVSITTNFTLVSGIYLTVVSVMFGINIALLTFYIRRKQEISRSTHIHFASLGGFISSVLGIGCAACGSVILTAVFGMVGAGSILTILPFHGLEFGVIGLGLLFLSIWYISKRISDPDVCPVKL